MASLWLQEYKLAALESDALKAPITSCEYHPYVLKEAWIEEGIVRLKVLLDLLAGIQIKLKNKKITSLPQSTEIPQSAVQSWVAAPHGTSWGHSQDRI